MLENRDPIEQANISAEKIKLDTQIFYVENPLNKYTPQQNGVAEQMNITLLKRTRAMLAAADLDKIFWA